MRFIRLLQSEFLNHFSRDALVELIIEFITPIFGLLITYYTYKFNNFSNFDNIFPRLILWIIFSRCFLIGSAHLIGDLNYHKNQSIHTLGFTKYHLIVANFVVRGFYEAIPTAIFYFLVLTYGFGMNYQPIQMLGFIGLILFASGLLYSFGVATKIKQTGSNRLYLQVLIYLIILTTSSPVININVIDPYNVWFHWFAIINPLASLNLLSQAVFYNLHNLAFLYLPLTSVLFWTIICPFLWKYLIWLKW